jgi:hypothetical protein
MPNSLPLTALIPAVAVIYLALALAVLGKRKSEYSHVVHTISELGEMGKHSG